MTMVILGYGERKMVDDLMKQIFEEVQSMKPKQKQAYIFNHSQAKMTKEDEDEESQWYRAVAEYGESEALHIVADEWGCSTHEVKRKIKRWDLEWL